MLKLGNMALQDEQWTEAIGIFNNVLYKNIQQSEAYLGKCMANYRIRTLNELETMIVAVDPDQPEKAPSILNDSALKRALEYGDESFKKLFASWMTKREENVACAIENEEKYIKAKELMNNGDVEEAGTIFERIQNFRDSEEYIRICRGIEDAAKKLTSVSNESERAEAMDSIRSGNFSILPEIKGFVGKYEKAFKAKMEKAELERKEEEIRRRCAAAAYKLRQADSPNTAQDIINDILDIADTSEGKKTVAECREKKAILQQNFYDNANHLIQKKKYQKAREYLVQLDGYKDSETLRKRCE